jgi:hypothetical protein
MAQRPTEGQLKTLRNIRRLEQGQQAAVNLGSAEECEDHGWVKRNQVADIG